MIKEEVLNGHISRFPSDLKILRKIEPDFDVTWASRSQRFNTDVSLFFIKPLPHISQAFGFDQELLVATTEYKTLEARIIQSIEYAFQHIPAYGRVDQTVSLVFSPASDADVWVRDYTAQHPQARAYIGISTEDLLQSSDAWFLRNKLMNQLFSRDLFDYTLPLDNDLFFFGRQAIVAEHIDAVRRSENRGIFGLRKTGKTSILFKIMRQCKENKIPVKYYDCKVSSIYNLTCDELLNRICDDIVGILPGEIRGWRSKKTAADRFLALVSQLSEDQRICLLFDEIEYIFVSSKLAPHWEKEFVPFWQTIWSAQSQYRRFSFIVAGVNASIAETDKIDGVQNPMFGIVKSKYLTGFEKGELHSLTSVFGKRMGLHFSEAAIELLHSRYGGHPLLTRMICSQIHTGLRVSRIDRPTNVEVATLLKDIDTREEELQFYCGHITSELEEFYAVEYEMLEMLAVGNVADFNELADDIDLVRHLKAYGLVDLSKQFEPRFLIPVIKKYISSKWRRKNGSKSAKFIVPPHRRQEFVAGRSSSLLREMRAAEKKFQSMGLPVLYGGHGPAEAELFANELECRTQNSLVSFLNQANRSLVEPIDRQGRKLGKKTYFFDEIKKSYPKIWRALNRVRAYRNHYMHLELNPLAQQQYVEFLGEDLDGKDPAQEPDGWFQIQSAVLNGLLNGLQAELAVYD